MEDCLAIPKANPRIMHSTPSLCRLVSPLMCRNSLQVMCLIRSLKALVVAKLGGGDYIVTAGSATLEVLGTSQGARKDRGECIPLPVDTWGQNISCCRARS